ncbi:hypothetical protein OO012_04550 [Rhodobacteraceae bacterium KMM 6894]|nr:hypothetical protein [Rhodobacteraceae bacterium KMM 6894]
MDKDTLDDLDRRRAQARKMGGKERLDRLAANGKLDARTRIDLLFDPGTFVEIGLLARSAHPDLHERTNADGLIAGHGLINGRLVYAASEDASILGGTRGRAAETKIARLRNLALKHAAPYVALMEAGAGRFQENNGASAVAIGNRFREHMLMSGRVPQVAAIMGACFGGPSFTAAQSDFVPMTKGTGFMGMSGPAVVRVGIRQEVTPDEIGGWEKSSTVTGQADYVGETDEDVLCAIREFLSFFPSNSNALPPQNDPVPALCDSPEGAQELNDLVPDNHRRAYSMARMIELLVDGGHSFEYRPTYGKSLITTWARFEGRPVGIVANNPMEWAGAMEEKSANKLRKFVDTCNAFHIPLVFLTDCPGFVVGPDIEDKRMVSLAARILNSVASSQVPKVTVVIRKAIGLAYLALGGKTMGPDRLVAWPTAQFDVMGPAAGIELTHGEKIRNSDDPDATRRALLARAEEEASTYLAAETGLLDDVIRPDETRRVIIQTLNAAAASQTPGFVARIDP